jgi:endonuclease/exonuclease/phosphatase family metal-dependent hydrolase
MVKRNAYTVASILAAAGIAAAGITAPAVSAAPATQLTVASFNVCKGGPDGTQAACAAPAPSWSVRRDRVVNVIRASGADVIGLQEVTNNPTPNGAKTMRDDVKAILAPAGYGTPTFDADGPDNDCKRPRDSNGQLAGPNPCENTAMITFNTATVQQAGAAGIAMAGNISPGLDNAASQPSAPRSVAWAFLKKGGVPFLAISAHTAATKDAIHEASRVAFAAGLNSWASNKIASAGLPAETPVVLMADLNSFDKRQPNGAQKVFRDNGWMDAFNAPKRTNIRYSTINYTATATGDAQGFPRKPAVTKKTKRNKVGAATRIDYIFTRNAPVVSYEVVMHLNADGSFNQDFQASDHQMIKASIQIA